MISHGGGAREIEYLFIDGNYLRTVFGQQPMWGTEPELDLKNVRGTFGSRKTFYYDCLDDIKRDSETPEHYASRVEAQQAMFDQIQSLPGFHVRLGGRLGFPSRGEKSHRTRDVCFCCLCAECECQGVVLGCGPVSCTLETAHHWADQSFLVKHELPSRQMGAQTMSQWQVVKSGKLNNWSIKVYATNVGFQAVINEYPGGTLHVHHRDIAVLMKYLSVREGKLDID
jgi:hypothetical protein